MSKVPKKLGKRFVKPAPGCMVHMEPPSRLYLDEAGELVPLTKYWNRRLRMVDVVECDPPKSVVDQFVEEHSDIVETEYRPSKKRTKKDEAQK